ncbi:MAG: PadR family transcriptional regulator [Candidatus Aenigmarchaeota archaeon]|nr:PadR family transcriptional regulator [Candidatus Aenigmarchaeota archaeon]
MKKEEGFMTNLVKFYMLMLLHEGPMHGYDIIDELGNRLGKKPSAGQIYPLLKRFQNMGYVSQEIRHVGKKKRKVYKITRKGRNFASGLLNKFSDILDVAVRQKITKCSHCGCEIYRGEYRQKIRGRILNFCCASCAKSFR